MVVGSRCWYSFVPKQCFRTGLPASYLLSGQRERHSRKGAWTKEGGFEGSGSVNTS